MRSLLLVVFLATISFCVHAQNPASLTIPGQVNQTLVLAVSDLEAFSAKTGGPVPIISASGETRRIIGTFRAVLLRDLLDRAGIQMANQKEKGRYYVVARATDGYTALFSHNELYNNPTGQQTYVLYAIDGKPIEKEGPFMLLVTNDLISGARHVKWLTSVAIQKVP